MNIRLTSTLLVLLFAATARAGQGIPQVTAASKQITLTVYGSPSAADPKLLPFIEGRTRSGKREHFGFLFTDQPRSAAIIELLGPGNVVLKTVTLPDMFGEGSRPSFTSSVLNDRRLESQFTTKLPDGKAQFLIRGLVTGDAGSAGEGQQLVISFAIRTDHALRASVRITLPVVGTAEVRNGSILVAPASGNATLAAVALPTSGTIDLKRKTLKITSPVMDIEGDRDTAMLWLVCKAFAASDAKSRSAAWARTARPGADDPRVIVVSSANKEATQPGDTVTYTLVCSNIGSGDATDVALSNPIPARARYVEHSATENDYLVNFTHGKGAPPERGDVKAITWKLPGPLAPGEERMVSFRVVIQ